MLYIGVFIISVSLLVHIGLAIRSSENLDKKTLECRKSCEPNASRIIDNKCFCSTEWRIKQ